ncbi:hypothetical protein LWI28_021068 [Acer negundo]|uniref:Uncharacterized protein n=1 Tax=Acer negundo TaxID=4023 RepID=A0AAD5NNS1_ACENE|nr:hypothetical protein LWI28_021068 [Acer negundo]
MVVFTPAVTGGFLDLGPSLNKGKEVSSQAMERIKCIVVDMENVTSLAMGEHGEMEKSSSLITLTPMMGWLRQMISPNLGVGPFLQNNKTSTYTPTSMVTKSPSSGPRLITNDIGQGLEVNISKPGSFKPEKWRRINQLGSTGENIGEELWKIRIDEF